MNFSHIMTFKMKVSRKAVVVENICRCQSNVLPETYYQLRERNKSLLHKTLKFLKNPYWV